MGGLIGKEHVRDEAERQTYDAHVQDQGVEKEEVNDAAAGPRLFAQAEVQQGHRFASRSSTLSTATMMPIIWGPPRSPAVPPAGLLGGPGGAPAYQVEQPPDHVLHPGGMAVETARAAAARTGSAGTPNGPAKPERGRRARFPFRPRAVTRPA